MVDKAASGRQEGKAPQSGAGAPDGVFISASELRLCEPAFERAYQRWRAALVEEAWDLTPYPPGYGDGLFREFLAEIECPQEAR